MASIREVIENLFHEALDAGGNELVGALSDDTVLLGSGLDSLGFAILVSRLEEELGFDPFTQLAEAIYPTTFGEFVGIYERAASRG